MVSVPCGRPRRAFRREVYIPLSRRPTVARYKGCRRSTGDGVPGRAPEPTGVAHPPPRYVKLAGRQDAASRSPTSTSISAAPAKVAGCAVSGVSVGLVITTPSAPASAPPSRRSRILSALFGSAGQATTGPPRFVTSVSRRSTCPRWRWPGFGGSSAVSPQGDSTAHRDAARPRWCSAAQPGFLAVRTSRRGLSPRPRGRA